MLATATSTSLIGLDAFLVRVEVEVLRGIPCFELVGLAEASVRESRVRVKSTLARVGIELGEWRIVVNLAPADLRKHGSAHDLAIAAATAAALGALPRELLDSVLLLGELSLDGSIHAVRGALPQILGARARGIRRVIIPRANAVEGAMVDGVEVRVASDFRELLTALRTNQPLPRASPGVPSQPPSFDDFSDVRGQASGRRAIEIAAAGGHNLVMIGPPGSGKTMLARRTPGILPPLERDEALEVMALHSAAGLLLEGATTPHRPFRAPHHTVSAAGMVGGGGDRARPGEVSLAHHGVLFLDELPEFQRNALEALRQPLEDGHVIVSRTRVKSTFPARPLFIGAMNPCPCGYQGDRTGRCRCLVERVRSYRSRLSGPLLDRVDIHVVLPAVPLDALQAAAPGESSAKIRERVIMARAAQRRRWKQGLVRSPLNARLSLAELERVAAPCPSSMKLLTAAVGSMGLSARAYAKVLRVSRTVADLEGSGGIRPAHVAEAVSARVLDRSSADSSVSAA